MGWLAERNHHPAPRARVVRDRRSPPQAYVRRAASTASYRPTLGRANSSQLQVNEEICITQTARPARQLSKSLAATYCINKGVPNDGNAEGDDEGRAGSKRHCGKMQGEQRHAKSGKSGNGVRQHGCRGRTANAAMQNEHDARVDDREHSKHAASCRTNLKA